MSDSAAERRLILRVVEAAASVRASDVSMTTELGLAVVQRHLYALERAGRIRRLGRGRFVLAPPGLPTAPGLPEIPLLDRAPVEALRDLAARAARSTRRVISEALAVFDTVIGTMPVAVWSWTGEVLTLHRTVWVGSIEKTPGGVVAVFPDGTRRVYLDPDAALRARADLEGIPVRLGGDPADG